MKKDNKTSGGINRSTLIGAGFLMATSAIGPGFLTQTATFTESLGPRFGFVVFVSVILALIAQLNIWRVIAVSGMRGQDVANKVLPGFGILISVLVIIGGLVFNIANIGGAALGLNVLFGTNNIVGVIISAVLAIFIFVNKNAGSIMDKLTTVLGAIMIVLIAYVMVVTKPPIGSALKNTILPDGGIDDGVINAILTLVGGTVGGYITFSGAHRLLDTGKNGSEFLPSYNASAKVGMTASTIVRILLFLAVLGVVSNGNALDATNPAADAFRQGAGELGYKFFGVVLFAAAISSVVGCAYTSVSFMTGIPFVKEHRNIVTIAFIVISGAVMVLVGQPATLLVVAGAVNGLILPFTLGAMLVASMKKDIVGEYKHPKVLLILGIVVVLITAYVGIRSFGTNIAKLFG